MLDEVQHWNNDVEQTTRLIKDTELWQDYEQAERVLGRSVKGTVQITCAHLLYTSFHKIKMGTYVA